MQAEAQRKHSRCHLLERAQIEQRACSLCIVAVPSTVQPHDVRQCAALNPITEKLVADTILPKPSVGERRKDSGEHPGVGRERVLEKLGEEAQRALRRALFVK
eukprot:5962310-Pleurochrysis_carterae.AAC.1